MMFIDAIPGALMGVASAFINSQAGWQPPTVRSFIISGVIGAILSAIAVRIATTPVKRILVALAILLVTLAVLWFGQTPRVDKPAFVIDDSHLGQEFGTAQDELREGSGPTGADGPECPRFGLGPWPEISAMPTGSQPGSRSQPLQIDATSSDGPIDFTARTDRPAPWDMVELEARVVEPSAFGIYTFGTYAFVPYTFEPMPFDGEVDFTNRVADIFIVQIDDGDRLITIDDGPAVPIPYGVIEFDGRFYNSNDRNGEVCEFLIYGQLVCKAFSCVWGWIAVAVLAGGAGGLVWQTTESPRRDRRSRNDAEPEPAEPAGGNDANNKTRMPRVRLDTADSASASPTADSASASLTGESVDGGGSAEVDDRRLGVQAFLDKKLLKSALVKDEKTKIMVSIATPSKKIAQLDSPFPADFGDEELLELTVKFKETTTKDQEYPEQTKKMTLERDPTEKAKVEFEVTPIGDHFSAMIAVFTDGESPSLIQAAKFIANVEDREKVDALEALEVNTFKLMINDVSSLSAPKLDATKTAAFVHDGHTALTIDTFALRTTVDEALNTIEQITAGLVDAAKERIEFRTNEVIHGTLLDTAIAGYNMRNDLGLAQFDDAKRFQVVSLDDKTVLPVELVYQSKESPDPEGSKMCPEWERDHNCTTCADLPADEQKHLICPSLFWGVTKIVEHHLPNNGDESVGLATDFGLQLLQDQHSLPMRVPTHAILGMSARVSTAAGARAGPIPAIAPDKVTETIVNQIRGTAALEVDVADTWPAWVAKVGQGTHDVLIAMPHNEAKSYGGMTTNAALEIGDTYVHSIDKTHVVADGNVRPLVLLIGCNTGSQVDAFASFAARFSGFSPYVIATIGEILAVEAPIVVATIMHHLREHASSEDKDGTIGAAVRDARLELLGKGHLAGLQLVVLGDGSWPLDT